MHILSKPINIIQVYFPTSESDEDIVLEVYSDLQKVLRNCPKNDRIVVMGDFNAKIGANTKHTACGMITILLKDGLNWPDFWNKPWIDSECWELIEERRSAKKEHFQGESYRELCTNERKLVKQISGQKSTQPGMGMSMTYFWTGSTITSYLP